MSTVTVIAPATLDAGYTFEATVDEKTFIVTVPEEGVEEGEEFEVPYPEDEEEKSRNEDVLDAPVGKWRSSLCSCCDVITQATFWMSFLLCPIQMAQIMTRLNLNWKGQKGTKNESAMTFNIITIMFVIVLYLWMIPVAGWVFAIGFFIFVLYIGANTRGHMRRKYEIPKGLFGIMGEFAGDFCCMFWCGCCSTIQMARHTHDDKEYPGYCCTTTGLEPSAPEVELASCSYDTLSESGTLDP